MNQKQALIDTIALAEELGMPEDSLVDESLGLAHMRSMLARIEEGDFSESKLGRWLGWAQAALVAAGVGAGLENVKAINLRYAD